MAEPALFLEIKGKKTGRTVLFTKLDNIYKECSFLIQGEDRLYPLICLRDTCHRNMNCMTVLAHRVKYVFDTFPDADILLLYFRYHDRPKSHRAGVFNRNMDEPFFITFNVTAWEKIKKIGTVYEWNLPDSLFLSSSDKLHKIGKSGEI